jgi:signal transduction histidine kinase
VETGFDEPAAPELRAFAAAVVHELRTPLSALSAEVDIALRRERPAAGYREALERIRRRVTELIEFSGDLAWLGQPPAFSSEPRTASLESLLTSIVQRSATTDVVIDRDIAGVRVQGDELVLTRGIWLLVEHAHRYRHEDAVVQVLVPRSDPPITRVSIVITATPPGFAAGAWDCLRNRPAHGVSAGDILRLRAAGCIAREVGGAFDVGSEGGGVTVRLRRG